MSPPSLGSKNKPSQRPALERLLYVGFFLDLFFSQEDGGDIFL
jgi:hypothetical protein